MARTRRAAATQPADRRAYRSPIVARKVRAASRAVPCSPRGSLALGTTLSQDPSHGTTRLTHACDLADRAAPTALLAHHDPRVYDALKDSSAFFKTSSFKYVRGGSTRVSAEGVAGESKRDASTRDTTRKSRRIRLSQGVQLSPQHIQQFRGFVHKLDRLDRRRRKLARARYFMEVRSVARLSLPAPPAAMYSRARR